jgi:hypothetical protein
VKKIAILTTVVLSLLATVCHAHYKGYEPQTGCGDPLSTGPYVMPDISPRGGYQKPHYGSFKKDPYFNGYRYDDSDGNMMSITPNRFGGWNVQGN